MNLLIDIGNSNTTFGISKNYKIKFVFHIPTNKIKSFSFFKKEIQKHFKKQKLRHKDILNIAVCSVVPQLDIKIKSYLKKIFKIKVIFFTGSDIIIPITNKYKAPQQVGKDRLVNALAVKDEYKLPAIVVDFGTAITIDVINEKAEYLGGVIVPGINLSLSSLAEKTALLPLLKARKPSKILGTSTQNSILSGIFYGYAFLVDGMIKALKAEQKQKFLVIATGGNLSLMRPLCKEINIFDQYLTLKGIEKVLLFAKYKENKR
ncbi:MAG: type III pantothenate kinase [Candidatus Omnitrophota bacterium]